MKYDENTVYYDDTLMTYVREKKEISFEEEPFNEVDALLLCQLFYPPLEHFVPKFKSSKQNPAEKHRREMPPTIGWADLDTEEKHKVLFGTSFYGTMYRQLYMEVKDSRRYGRIRFGYLRAMTDQKKVVQFAAVTAFLNEKCAFVIFRGTDSTLTGWMEDFKYSYAKIWPAHAIAREYLLDVARLVPGQIYVGGHSKGGNLAVYASAFVPQYLQERILRVFSFDGMGFRSGFYRTDGYKRIAERVFKLVPNESLIGMLFVPENGFRIVDSYEHGFLQHDLMNWKIRDGEFVLREHFSRKQNRLINRLNRWILSLTGRERKSFVEILFASLGDLLENECAQTMTESGSAVRTMWNKFRAMTKEEKRLFLRSVRRFAMPKKPPHTHKRRRKKHESD